MNKHPKDNARHTQPSSKSKQGRHKPAFSRLDWAAMVLVLLLSLAVLYWMLPFVGKYAIGNDYLNYWINMQMYLRFSISNGTFPLYAPGFNDGWTASALTLGQLYHPVSWLAATVPGYWTGHAHQIGTALRLTELAGTCLALFLFLRKLRLEIPFAVVLSFITVYNLRMLDMFRYGASLENYAAMLLLCAAMGWFYLAPKSRLMPLCITICSWLLVVGGHPQMMYIGFLGMAFVILVFPFYLSYLLPDEAPLKTGRVLKYWGLTAFSMTLGIILASAYTLPFYFEYIQTSSRKLGENFNWACSQQDTLSGTLCNFFNPFFSDVHGAFGGSALILLAALLPLAGVFYLRRSWPVLCLWLACVVVIVTSMGSTTPLYYYFWKYFPLAHTFRVPGRLCMVLPPMFMLILAWLVQQKAVRLRIGKRDWPFDPVVLTVAVALVIFVMPKGLDYAALTSAERYVPANINKIPPAVMSMFFVCGLISLVAIILYRASNKLRSAAGFVMATAVLLGVTVALSYGTWLVKGHKTTRTLVEMRQVMRQRLIYTAPTGEWSRSIIEEHLKHTFLEPGLARFCRKYQPVGSKKESYQRLAKLREIDLVYVEDWPEAKEDNKTVDSSSGIDRVELKYSSFNNLIFDVTCDKAGFFVLSFPYEPYWHAKIDDEDRTIYRCNAIEQGIRLLPGRHKVEFRYRSPATTVGAVLGCLAAIAAVWYLFRGAEKSRARRLAVTATAVLCSLLLAVWHHSLYQGGNIGTYYLWTSKQIQPHLSSLYNLAYGKKTEMGDRSSSWSYTNDCSLGVDGDRDGNFAFVTSNQEHARWQVDLDINDPIGEIVLYKQRSGYSGIGIPFDVLGSQDGKNWFKIGAVETDTADNFWRIHAPGIKANYIRLQTRHKSILALSEVEVYRRP